MADMLSILIIMIVAYICGKKLIIPRILVMRAAKKAASAPGPAPGTAVPDGTPGMAAVQAALQAVPSSPSTAIAGTRPITCFDMRLISTSVSDSDKDADGNGDSDTVTAFIQRVTYAANEMLLNASLRGDNVRLGFLNCTRNTLMLYITYTVR
ncbi:MAG: hypothetical protein HFI55_09535 [Lachnospiraceae bacterium]|jgi:hypothetical protein|nr:hypothetical protein [Lachnospiraceae bacterium]